MICPWDIIKMIFSSIKSDSQILELSEQKVSLEMMLEGVPFHGRATCMWQIKLSLIDWLIDLSASGSTLVQINHTISFCAKLCQSTWGLVLWFLMCCNNELYIFLPLETSSLNLGAVDQLSLVKLMCMWNNSLLIHCILSSQISFVVFFKGSVLHKWNIITEGKHYGITAFWVLMRPLS